MNKRILNDINEILQLPEIETTDTIISMHNMSNKLSFEFSKYPVTNEDEIVKHLNQLVLKRILNGIPKVKMAGLILDESKTTIALLQSPKYCINDEYKVTFELDEENTLLVTDRSNPKFNEKLYKYIKKNHIKYIKEQLELLREFKSEFNLNYIHSAFSLQEEVENSPREQFFVKYPFKDNCITSKITYHRKPNMQVSISPLELKREEVTYEGPTSEELMSQHKTSILKRSPVEITKLPVEFQKIIRK